MDENRFLISHIFILDSTSRGGSERFGSRPFSVFGFLRVHSSGNGRMFGSNLRQKLLRGVKGRKIGEQEAIDGVWKQNDGAAGTCPGKNTSAVRCHEREAEYLRGSNRSPSLPQRLVQSAV